VAAGSLLLDDSFLSEFDSNYKLDPPLRNKKDVQALRNAVENGTIDVIVSDHLPQDTESKELEFDLAEVGMINLQTAFSCALEAVKEKNIEKIIACFTEGPSRILRLENQPVEEGVNSNLTLFTTSSETLLTEKNNFSRSRNSPFFNKKMQGRVVGVINGTRTYFNS
jgi:dihydroorotase